MDKDRHEIFLYDYLFIQQTVTWAKNCCIFFSFSCICLLIFISNIAMNEIWCFSITNFFRFGLRMLNHPRLFSNSMKNTRISEDQSLNDTTALPFTSSNFFGKSQLNSSPWIPNFFPGSTASLRPLLAGMTNLHRTESLTGLDKFPRTDLSSAIQSKDPPSMKSTTSTSFLFDNKSTPSGAMVTFDRNFPLILFGYLDIRFWRESIIFLR